MPGRTADMQQDLTTHELVSLLEPGDTVLIGQAAAEPPGLVSMLIDAAGSVPRLTAFCGYTLSDAWKAIDTAGPQIKTYAAHGVFRGLMNRGGVDVLPLHLTAVERDIDSGRLPVDVVMLQVGPKDDDGYYSLGATVDYAVTALEHARVVLVEVNRDMPRGRTDRRLHESRVTGAIAASLPLAGSPARPPSEIERRVARNVAGMVESGSTVQLGAGALADAVAGELRFRRSLQVRSGLVGDWLVDLYDSGAIRSGDDSTVASMALGTRRLYDFVDSNPSVRFIPHAELVDPVAVAACGSFVAINSAIEVDLTGAINSEVVGGRYVGAVGGQVDFFRATRAAARGLAVVALASTHRSGESRIVSVLQGPVTSLKSDVDVVVTEWGVADLRAASLEERARRLLAVAAPEHRNELTASYVLH